MPPSTPPPPSSVFLDRPAKGRVAENDLAFALRDGFPISPGPPLRQHDSPHRIKLLRPSAR